MILENFLLFTEIPTEKMLQRQISSLTFFLENIFDDTQTHLGHLTSPAMPTPAKSSCARLWLPLPAACPPRLCAAEWRAVTLGWSTVAEQWQTRRAGPVKLPGGRLLGSWRLFSPLLTLARTRDRLQHAQNTRAHSFCTQTLPHNFCSRVAL